MDDRQQKQFLIDLARNMIRDLIVYRTGIEYFKRNPSDVSGMDGIMSQARNDPGVRTQLGDDFQVFLEGVLALDKADAQMALEKFLREWSPRSAAN
jgi:hypothetical protein